MAGKEKLVSLADLNVVKRCEESAEMEYMDAGGKGTGVFLSVVGAHAPRVQNWINRELNNRRRYDAVQAKRGKLSDVRMIEDDIDFGVEVVSIRITGWRGITDPFNAENSLELCKINPEICQQVREFSENIANFTQG